MLKGRILKHVVAAAAITSVLGLTSIGTQALAVTAAPRATVSHSMTAHTTGTTVASAAATTSARLTAKWLTQIRHGEIANSCPSRTVCPFTGHNYTGTEGYIPTADWHSQWFDFDLAVGFHPNSLIDNSGSDIWVLDRQTGVFACIPGGAEADFEGWQPGWFFIQYNVNTCTTPPPGL